MGEKEHSLFFQKQELLKRRKQLLDIKLQLQKDIHTTRPIEFGSKFDRLSKGKISSVADRLQHKFSDVRFLEPLECHLLCGLKVITCNESKLVVQFRPSYLEKILPEVYAVSLLAGNNGYSVQKYYLPHSVKIDSVVQRWLPLKKDNLKNFFLDIKQQINAFHHRQNQILQLKEWANSQNTALKVFHPLSLNYIIITLRMDDNLKFKNFRSLSLILHYDSKYLPTTIDIESSEMEEEELGVAKEQFSAFKLYSLREAFEICCIKTERFSLPAKEDVSNENLREEDNVSTAISSEEEEENISDVSSTADSGQLKHFRTLSQVDKEKRLIPIVEKARKSKSKSSTKGKSNQNRHNSSSAEEDDIAEMSKSSAPEIMEEARKPKSKSSRKGKSNKNRHNSSSVEEDDIAEMSSSDDSENVALQLKTKRSLGSVLQKAKKSKSKYSAKGARDIASESNKFQIRQQLKTLSRADRKAPKKKYSPDDAPDDILHTRKKKSPQLHSTNKASTEVPTPLQTNKITRYLLKSKR